MPVIAATHTVVKSSPATHRFGSGIIPHAGRRMPYTQEDLDAAVLMFADDAEPDYESMALEAAWTDQFNGSFPEFGACALCGQMSDYLEANGLCPACDVIACEKSTPNRSR